MATPKMTEAEALAALGGAPDDDIVTDGEVVGDVEPYADVSGAELARYVTTIQDLVVDDPDAIALKIAQRRLNAKSVDELLAPQEIKSARDYTYRPLNIREVHFNRSRFEGGVQVYAVFDAVDESTGEVGTFACGAADVLVQLYKLVDWGALPITVQIVPARNPSANGHFPLHLEAVTPPEAQF